jgi:hypothetical protein
MDSKKLYFILLGVLVLLGIGMIASAKEANTLLERQSHTLVSLKANDQQTNEQKSQLAQDKKDIANYSDLNTIAQSVVPQDKDQAEAVQQIVNLASASGIPQLSSITFPPSTLGGTVPSTVKTPNGLTQVTPVKDIPGVYDLEITVTQASTSEVPYNNFISFLQRLEQNRRTAEVTSITVQPDQKNPTMISFTLIIDEFIKP